MPKIDPYTLQPLSIIPETPTRQTPNWTETAGAAFEQENAPLALAQWLDRPAFEPDPEFDLAAALTEVPDLYDNYRTSLSARSRPEFDYKVGKLRAEIKNEQILAASGLSGVLWATAAGMASPTTLLPIVGLGVRASRAARAGVVAANAAGGVALDEVALRANNVTRTDADTALAIGGATVLGAALGAVLPRIDVTLRAKAIKEIEDIILDPTRRPTEKEAEEYVAALTGGVQGLSAQAVDTVRLAGPISFGARTGIGRRIAEISPAVAPSARLTDTSRAPLKNAAAFQQQFTTGGLRVDSAPDPNSTLGMKYAVAEGGQLEGQSRYRERTMDARVADLLMTGWMKHDEIKPGMMARARAEASSIFSGTRLNPAKPGKLSFDDWNKELTRAMHMGDTSAWPEIEELAKRIRSEVIAPITQAAQKAGLLPAELTEEMLKGAKSYLMRVYDHDALAKNPQAFVELLVRHNVERTTAKWQRQLADMMEKNAADMDALKLRTMAVEKAEELQAELKGNIESMSTGPRAQTVSAYADLRREADRLGREVRRLRAAGQPEATRDLDRQVAELREQARKMKETNPEINEFLGEKRALERRLKSVRGGLFKLEQQQARALDEADKITRMMEDELKRFAPKFDKLMRQLDDLTDAGFEEQARRLAKEFDKLEEQMLRGDETLARLAAKHPELVDAPAEFVARAQRFKEAVFDQEVWERGPRGEKVLRIDSEMKQKAALEAIDAVLDEGEVKVISGEDVTFTPLTPAMTKSLREWREAIASLKWSDQAKLEKAEARFDREIARQVARQEKQDSVLERLMAADTLDRDAVQTTMLDRLQEMATITAERNAKRAVREAGLRAKASKLGFEDIPNWFKENERLADAPRLREEQFRDAARRAGADDVDIAAGKFDFERSIRDEINKLVMDIRGNFVRTPGVDLVAERGPELARLIDVPYDKKVAFGGREWSMEDFLVKDVAQVLRSYVRTMVPDTVMASRFNDKASLPKWLGDDGFLAKERQLREEQIANDLDFETSEPLKKPRSQKEKERLNAQLAADYKYAQQMGRTMVARLRHQDGIPEDPASGWVRASRTWRAAQVPIYMGGVAISSIPELAAGVMRYGLDAFRDGWAPMITRNQEWMRAAAEAEKSGQGLDPVLNTRLMAWSDLGETNVRHTPFEKVVEFMATKTGALALFDQMTKFQKNLVAGPAIGAYMRAVEAVATGRGVGRMTKAKAIDYVSQAGLSENLLRRTWEQVKMHGSERTSSGYLYPNFDKWTDQEALDVFRSYMSTMLDVDVITPGMERPMFMTKNEVARIIMQFRSFTISATTKVLLRGLQQWDAAVLAAYLGYMSLGAASYYAWAALHGPGSTQWEEAMNADWRKVADESIYRSGVLAAFGEMQALLSDFPLTHGLVNFSDQGAERLRNRDYRETLLGVSAGTADRIGRVLRGIDSPTQSTTKAAEQLLPYNNVWYLRSLIDKMREGMDETLNVPETR